MAKVESIELVKISARGVVQGVGFRPFVYQLATKYNLKGWVCNTSGDVKIEVEGNRRDIEQFLLALEEQAPPLAHIEAITATYHPPVNYQSFDIRQSITEEGQYQLVSPDIATCPDCLSEIFDPDDRRYRYPFTNCTNCGPRFTIIRDIPYDRANTTMQRFRMCPECRREYDDPLNRRFHAQPNACPVCGPKLELTDAQGKPIITADALSTASQLLKQGKILAIKGLGGFLLAVDATNEAAVMRLRRRKQRPFKPLAIMAASIEAARQYCHISAAEEALLTSPHSPIVLLRWQDSSDISPAVSPNLKYLGVMLPYTPLHHILLRETGLPLVMTSGNLSEEPIAKDNDEALTRLAGIADYFLMHNRDIYARYDDSVTMVESDNIQLVRRARGYAPSPIHLPFNAKPILGCGAELKNTFCLTRDRHAFLSPHIGDMENIETLEHFQQTVELYQQLFRIKPHFVAHDMHPDYLATKYARKLADRSADIRLCPVQHHHAHIASCMADNSINTPVIGVAFDGTGYGADGNLWGGEFMVADYRQFTRMGHFEYLPLPGGEQAIKKPYRIAIGYITALLGADALTQNLPFLEQVDPLEIDIIKKQVAQKLNTPYTSSCGRLFDAVAALTGIRGEIGYEGQAAIELEMTAYEEIANADHYPFSITRQGSLKVIRLKTLLAAIIRDLQNGTNQATIAIKFHNSLAKIILALCQIIRDNSSLSLVALSGGVFQNRLLLRKTTGLLAANGFEVLTHHQVPCNDGGIALGQAVIANANSH